MVLYGGFDSYVYVSSCAQQENVTSVYQKVWPSDISPGCKDPITPVIFTFPVFCLLRFINYMGMLKYNFML